MSDPHHLERFVEAQSDGVHERALGELRAGRKTSHWMWFVFPQVAGLGSSPTAQHYAIGSLDEACAYLAHPVLGPRLVEAARAVLTHPDRSARQIMGTPDDVKLRSSMTLFAVADESEPVFTEVIDAFFDGGRDPRTLETHGRWRPSVAERPARAGQHPCVPRIVLTIPIRPGAGLLRPEPLGRRPHRVHVALRREHRGRRRCRGLRARRQRHLAGPPLRRGPLGALVDAAVLRRYLTRLLARRNAWLAEAAA